MMRAPLAVDARPVPDLGHVPALDGIRAVSVLAVLAFHAGAPWLPGGFLGVDVFFVLSGYLITTLLLQEWRATRGIRLAAFWGRRVRRLVPALVLVVVATLLTAQALGDARGGSNGRDAVASLLYLNNWNQVATQTNYFDTFLGASPFLHTWSLAIEEQFYLVWPPVLLWFLLRRGGRLQGLPWLLVAVVVLSAGVMIARYDEANPTAAYVATDARIQTIALGAVAAVVMLGRHGPAVRTAMRSRRGLTTVGMAAAGTVVLAGMILAREDSRWLFPWGFLAVATASAVLIAGVVHAVPGPVTAMLSWRPLVAVGLISYGVYLWHWPVFVLLDGETTGLSGPALVTAQLATTFGLATASFVLVERPVRRRALARRFGVTAERGILAGAVAAATALALAVAVTEPAVATNGEGDLAARGAGATRVFVFGDSVVFGLLRDFEPTRHPALTVSGSSHLGCPPFDVTNDVAGTPDPPKAECSGWFAGWPAELAADAPDVAVLPASQWLLFDPIVDGRTLSLGSPEWRTWLAGVYDQHVDLMAATAAHVVLVDQPCYRVYDDGKSPFARTIDDDERVATYNAFLRDYARERGLPLLGLNAWLCGPGRDPEQRDGIKMRVEGLHFTYEGASLVWDWMGPQLEAVAARTQPATSS